ncbi:MAG: PEP-CTERM sorting domain-containing protein [Planctomycetota bacterium]
MRTPPWLATALLAFALTPANAGIVPDNGRVYLHGGLDLSFIEDFLDQRGVHVDLPKINVDLPAEAESAVADAFERADAALNRVFGDGGLLDNDVDEIIDDALEGAQDALDGIDLPDVDAIVEDALGRAEEVLTDIDARLPANTQQIVEDALNDARQSVDSALDEVFGEGGVLDEIDDLTPAVDEVLEDLDVEGVLEDVDRALSEVPIDRLPDAAINAIDNAAGIVEQVLGDLFGSNDNGIDLGTEINGLITPSFGSSTVSSLFVSVPASSSPASIPEPTTAALAALGIATAAARRR